jgi:hypothetical protein
MAECTWTESEKQSVIRLWREGWTAGRIAATMQGRSRNAIIGIVHRMKLDKRPTPIRKRADGPVVVRLKPAPPPREPKPLTPAPVIRLKPPRVVQPATAPNPFKTCQFIEGTGRPWAMCGEPTVVGHSWCEGHCRRVYQQRDAAE